MSDAPIETPIETPAPVSFSSKAELDAYIASHYPDLYKPIISKYAPKLSFVERCQVLALMLSNLDRRIVGAAYGINRGTVSYIVNEASPHYKDVRRELKDHGLDRFLAKYLTPVALERYAGAKNDQQTLYSDDELRRAKEKGELPGQEANPKAVKSEGVFWFTGMWGLQVGTYKAEVKWTDEPGPDPADFLSETPRTPGWYIHVKDAEDDNTFYIAGSAADSKTSTSARDAWLKANEYELSR